LTSGPDVSIAKVERDSSAHLRGLSDVQP